MDKKQLQNILSSAYSLENWREVLTNIFNVRSLNLEPKPILLPANNKADSAFELGNFNTSDDRIIGIYQVNVTADVWLERNKVGLRELLRNVYKYDVDGALVVFVQEDKWRLSFISEIRTINEQGEIEKKATEPKRYTYLFGKGEKTKTPTNNLFAISGKKHTLEDIRNAFSVEALNEEFYKIIAEQFYKLVGATAGKGAKEVKYVRVLQLPSVSETDHKTFQEFAVRLIGRAVFCWFLKVKKSDEGIPLLPENLLSSISVKENEGYYHTILERLFFQTLNTKVEKRVKDLPKGTELIPFLNGGLFEPQDDDFYKPNKSTGLSENLNTLVIPDQWFIEFFEKLEQYNFTIDENSVVDIEVSVDPEMLGRIFENLLAEIDPDSGETARKATGSFYTPREIVDYMATESLVHYLQNKTGVEQEALHSLFKIDQSIHSSLITHNSSLLEALDSLKILDPACGSGAFPMGVLQKIVMALQKLDKDAVWWTARQVDKNTDPTARKAVKEKLANNAQYARKIGIIQNSLYGVDIQPIAAEISKLRCFLTLIVDEHIIETKPNRGIEPLPNLEFKFVTADTLRKLPSDSGDLFNNFDDDLDQLKRIRLDYLQSTGDEKLELKQEFKTIQDSVVKKQAKTNALDPNSRAFLISTWNPFSHEKVDWFDPQWMYGLEKQTILKLENRESIEITRLNKQIVATNAQIDAINLSIQSNHSAAIIKLQLITADLQTTAIEQDLELIKKNIEELYGNIKPSLGSVVDEPENIEYKISALNKTIERLNTNLRKLNKTLKPVVQTPEGGYFDIVIGNPPYVGIAKVSTKNILKNEGYKTYESTGDLYSLFYERGNQLLKLGGCLCYITSNKWLRAGYGKSLRQYFIDYTNPTKLIDFGQAMIFKSAIVHSNILLFERESNKRNLLAVQFKQENYISNFNIEGHFEKYKTLKDNYTSDIWSVVDDNLQLIKYKIEKRGIPLKNWKIKINFGLKTGFNEGFILTNDVKEKLVSEDAKNLEIIKPILRGRDVRKYNCNFANLWIINSHNGMRDAKIPRIDIPKDYPTINSYLSQFLPEIEQRADKGDHWTNLRNCAYLNEFSKPKIVFSEIVSEAQFHYDEKGYYPEATVFFMTGEHLKYLISFLNSKPVTFFFKTFYAGGELVGKFRYKKAFLENLPIPQIKETDEQQFVNLVDYILFLNNKSKDQQINEHVPNSHIVQLFEEVIDAMVFELYFEEDFKKADIAFIKYAERDFQSIDGKSEEEAIKIIHSAYQKLREKDNEIRNNLKLMDTRLHDLVMPIKTAK